MKASNENGLAENGTLQFDTTFVRVSAASFPCMGSPRNRPTIVLDNEKIGESAPRCPH